ncbi:MAG: hypothetical protein ACOVQX_05435 [Legionella sp.]
MPGHFDSIIAEMRTGWNNSWFNYLFRFTDLGRLFNQPQPPSPHVFVQTYLSSWWWNRFWFSH